MHLKLFKCRFYVCTRHRATNTCRLHLVLSNALSLPYICKSCERKRRFVFSLHCLCFRNWSFFSCWFIHSITCSMLETELCIDSLCYWWDVWTAAVRSDSHKFCTCVKYIYKSDIKVTLAHFATFTSHNNQIGLYFDFRLFQQNIVFVAYYGLRK